MSEITRSLASIQKIASIRKHNNADTLEIAEIKGWEVIIKSGIHHEGELVIYFEIDSFLPVDERFEFLRKNGFKSTKNLGDGFRLRTMKLRGEVSQGLIMPLFQFPELDHVLPDDIYSPQFELEEINVTEELNIQKYEKPIPANLQGIVRGNFPTFIFKTDEERFENLSQRTIAWHADDLFEVSLKADGSSMTVYKNLALKTEEEDKSFGVCSRNWDLEETEDNLFWKVARKLNLEEILADNDWSIALQGELVGPGVNGNTAGFDEHDFYVFNIFDIEKQTYLKAEERQNFLKRVGLKSVPIISSNTPLYSKEKWAKIADSVVFNDKPAEGIVCKSLTDPHFSFKKISAQYLLKHERD